MKGFPRNLMLALLVLSASMWLASSSVSQAVAASDVTGTHYSYRVLSGQHTVSGSQQVLVVLVDFQDVKHSMTADEMKTLAIDEMNSYYSDVSYGKISISGDVYGWYTVSHSMSYYGRDRRAPGEDLNLFSLAEDATALLPSSVNLGSFKFLMIIHAGQDQAAGRSGSVLSGQIWSQTSCAVFPDYTPPDPVMVRSKTFQCVTFLSEFDGLGTFVHETGHLFGLPDLYDASTSDSYVGYWSLMDSGAFCCTAQNDQTPSYIGAWGTAVLGWITPATPDPNTVVSSFTLNPLESPNASSILIPLSSTQYYVIEYRQKIGEDSSLPSFGIIVSYVDESLLSGEGVVRLVNPSDGALFPSQTYPEDLNGAAFTVGSAFSDPTNHVFLSFQSSGSNVIAVYSTQELAGSPSETHLKPFEASFSGSYGQSIVLTGTLTDGNGMLIASQPIQLEIFNSTTAQWQVIGEQVTDQQGVISFQVNMNYPVGDYETRFVYDGGQIGAASHYGTSAEFTTSIKPAKLTISVSAPSTSTTDNVPIQVSVVGADGKPLAGVSVGIYTDKIQRAVVQSNSAGEASVVLTLGLSEVGSQIITVVTTSTNYTPTQASASLLVIPPLWLIALLTAGVVVAITVTSLVIFKQPRDTH